MSNQQLELPDYNKFQASSLLEFVGKVIYIVKATPSLNKSEKGWLIEFKRQIDDKDNLTVITRSPAIELILRAVLSLEGFPSSLEFNVPLRVEVVRYNGDLFFG